MVFSISSLINVGVEKIIEEYFVKNVVLKNPAKALPLDGHTTRLKPSPQASKKS